MSKPRAPKGRSINGILLLDKPKGLTSNLALQITKRLYNAEKAGHTGSLDPLASGMLPICFGEATKFSQFLLEADKRYQVTAQLGIKTTTGDTEGEVIGEKPIPHLSEEAIEKLFATFIGAIQQIPSMYSAIKQNGQPLYKLARQGIEVTREPRTIQIYSITYLSHNQDSISFAVHCSKGTYVRTLVEDMGEALGCGAHVTELRRLTVGSYQAEQMQTLSHLEELAENQAREVMDSYLLRVDSAIVHWPELPLSEAAIYYIKQGQPVIAPYAPSSGWVKITRKNGDFLGVGEILDDGRLAPRRLVQTS
jgi:tRNA pseudouridine55 synthase